MPTWLHAVVQHADDLDDVRFYYAIEDHMHRVRDRCLSAFAPAAANVKLRTPGRSSLRSEVERPSGSSATRRIAARSRAEYRMRASRPCRSSLVLNIELMSPLADFVSR